MTDGPDRAGAERRDWEELGLSVPDMDCPSCASKVESSLAGLAGVEEVETRPASGRVVVRHAGASPEAVRERIEAAGYGVERDRTETFEVPEMDCASCATKVGTALDGQPGVLDYETKPAAGRVSVTLDPDRTGREAVVAAIEAAGYGVTDAGGAASSPREAFTGPRARKTWAGAVLLVAGIAAEFLVPGEVLLASALGREISLAWLAYVGAAVVAGGPVVRAGYYSARNRSLDIDLLMSAGILGALIVDLPFEAATLAVLFNIAELLERFSMDRARSSLRELVELSPDVATVRRDGEERTVPVEDVSPGETVVVRPGDRIPLDGRVIEGTSAVDESPVTGESVPADKRPGDEVYAGSIVAEGYLEVEATATAADSTIARVIELVEDAESAKTDHERFIDRFARYYTPAIVAGSILTILLSPVVFGVGPEEAFVRGLTLLVIACPCAFVISTPVTVVSGITSAARNGVLVKGGDRLEAMGEVETVAFDKTGTLTTGDLGVTDVLALDGDERDVLSCARAVEERSEHPIARAIVAHAEEHGVPGREVSGFEALPGSGVRADVDGVIHYAGKPSLFESLGFDLGHAHAATDGGLRTRPCEHGAYVDLAEQVERLQAEGKSVVLVGTAEEIEGVLGVADTVREGARETVERLRERGLETVMLTGDNERTARAVGKQVGVDEVRADLLPEEKVEAVESLRERGPVAMVGDGVNDAPALSAADVGIAMGAAGTDTAIETADAALMGDDIGRVPYLHELAQRANRVIRVNVGSSLAVKAALAVGAPLGLVSVFVAIVVGDMGMSLGVTGNAMRLARLRP